MKSGPALFILALSLSLIGRSDNDPRQQLLHQIQKLDSIELPEDLKGKCDATESVWLLQQKC